MACSCQTRMPNDGIVQSGPPLPHEVLPAESCIFCADKHVSTAYAEAQSGCSWSVVIGELELARRHTLAEYADVAGRTSRCLYAALTRDIKMLMPELMGLMGLIQQLAAVFDPDKRAENKLYAGESPRQDAANPFIGELHLYAAYRLAQEVGYMTPNRQMIIGDLTLAREHLCRFDASMSNKLRELRHRVQTVKASDLNVYWPYVCDNMAEYINARLEDFMPTYSDGLKAYLGI